MAASTQIIILSLLFNGIICDTNYRLNARVIPSEYVVTITPYFDTGDTPFTFDGEVTIKVTTAFEGVNQIKLHSEDLEIDGDNVTVRAGNSVVGLNTTNPIEFDKTYTFAYINLASELSVNTEYEINIVYKGPIRTDLNGFYRSSYVENGQTKWLGATQMEPVHTRKAFPCFDEPSYKARFTLIIDRPEGYVPSLTNTKLENSTILNNGYIRERFRQTPVMSTYLVAFLVSELQAGTNFEDGDREFGVWARPEATNQTDFAFDFGKRVVAALGNYTGIDYYTVDSNLRLDHVGLPDFRAGAMENWGLIKYREALLLYVPGESTPYYRYRVAQIVAHETTHMWFGNLVTCHWWSDTWLNEGFANYFQDYITAEVEPELESGDLLVTSSVYQAYAADGVATAAPITNDNVNSPTEISTHFGTVSYQKAGSIIRMIHHWVGDEAFRRGLYEHLNAARLSAAYPEDLYLGLQTGVSYTNSLSSFPGYTVASLMRPWITQAGHPVVRVELNRTSNEITLTQNRFYANGSLHSDELYPIPITYSQESASNFIDTKPRFIMSIRTQSLPGNFSDEEWIIFNVQETGFYRVNYDDHLWSLIGDVLRGENRTAVHHLNRAKIVNDLFALAGAEQVSYRLAFEVLEFLAAESDYSVWSAAVAGLNALRNRLLRTADAAELEAFALRLLNTVVEDLGFDERDEDSFVTLRNRMQIMDFACGLGHQACQDHAVSVFRNFRDNNVPVPPSLRPVVYCYGLQHGSAEDYDALYQRKLTTNVANEALVIETALGCSTVQEKLESYLTQMVSANSSLRDQDVSVPLTSVLSHPDNFRVAFVFLQENYAALRGVYTTISNILAYFPPAITKEEDLEEFEEWLSSCPMCAAEETEVARAATVAARESLAWTRAHAVDIVQPLREKNGAATLLPSLVGLLFSIFLIQINI